MILKASRISKQYSSGGVSLAVLKGVDFSLREGESVAVMGPSGSGKSTLLQILGFMFLPDSGELEFRGRDMLRLGDTELSQFRRRELGFVFQKFNLLGTLSARENVAWPLLIDGKNRAESLAKADALLARVGLKDRGHHSPSQLSGGEQQRVAIARALVANPPIVFADEPTGALDSANGVQVLELLRSVVKEQGSSMVMVTHDPNAAAYCDRLFRLKDGKEC
jgi:putative ABC transport system ATP-binding protein